MSLTWAGTDDRDDNPGDGTVWWSPDVAGHAEFNLIKVSESTYDGGRVADGNLTRSRSFVTSAGRCRVCPSRERLQSPAVAWTCWPR